MCVRMAHLLSHPHLDHEEKCGLGTKIDKCQFQSSARIRLIPVIPATHSSKLFAIPCDFDSRFSASKEHGNQSALQLVRRDTCCTCSPGTSSRNKPMYWTYSHLPLSFSSWIHFFRQNMNKQELLSELPLPMLTCSLADTCQRGCTQRNVNSQQRNRWDKHLTDRVWSETCLDLETEAVACPGLVWVSIFKGHRFWIDESPNKMSSLHLNGMPMWRRKSSLKYFSGS